MSSPMMFQASASLRIISSAITPRHHCCCYFHLFPPCFCKPLISQSSCFTSSLRPKSISFQPLPTRPHSLNPNSLNSDSNSPSSPQPIEELPPKLQEIITLFQATDDSRAKYQQLLFYGATLPNMDDRYKTDDNKVQGCVSQVWVRAFLGAQDKVYYQADSDTAMTKGLAALLVKGLSGHSVQEIVRVMPDFVTLLGLHQSLTPSRNNGFLNMLKLMQRKALYLGLQAHKEGVDDAEDSRPQGQAGGVNLVESSQIGSDDSDRKHQIGGVNGVERVSLDETGLTSELSVDDSDRKLELGNRGQRIRDKLEKELKPRELEVEDVSYQHAGHAGVRGSDGETHFNLKIVSDEFEGKSLVKRHRMIYGLLQDELQGGLHALSITAKTPSEVEQSR